MPDQIKINSNVTITTGSLLAGRYELLDVIGTGGMGSVWKARQTDMDTLVAVKLLNPNVTPNPVAFERFENEARVLGSLNHPAIPQIRTIDRLADGSVFIAMDLVEGESLHQILHKRGKLPAEEAIPMFLRLANALQHAHEIGVIHRDIKPSNIIVDANGDAHLLDFGIAKVVGSAQSFTQTGALVGTALYMSPEQAQGTELTFASDIYSLACVLYEALSGDPIFKSSSPLESMMMHVHSTIPTLGTPQLSKFSGPLAKALEKQPSRRFPSMSAFAAALRAPDTVARYAKNGQVNVSPKFVLATLVFFAIVLGGTLAFNIAGSRPAPVAVQGPVRDMRDLDLLYAMTISGQTKYSEAEQNLAFNKLVKQESAVPPDVRKQGLLNAMDWAVRQRDGRLSRQAFNAYRRLCYLSEKKQAIGAGAAKLLPIFDSDDPTGMTGDRFLLGVIAEDKARGRGADLYAMAAESIYVKRLVQQGRLDEAKPLLDGLMSNVGEHQPGELYEAMRAYAKAVEAKDNKTGVAK